jgi:uncharacterized protein YciU (UPF0263 family)
MTDIIVWYDGMQIDPIDPADVDKIKIDWSSKLGSDTIASADITSDTLTVSVDNFTDDYSIVAIDGSDATPGSFHEVTASIVTSDGRPLHRSFTVPIKNL